MVVHEHTRIAELIKANSECIAAIGSLSKPLRKLSNPLLRRVLAPRVTIAEAAAMGGCSVADFRRVLEPLGFTFSTGETGQASTPVDDAPQRPAWLPKEDDKRITYFDVRDLIEQGNDPLKAILQRYTALSSGHVLCIVNSFVPYPLITLLEKKGAQTFVETLEPTLHYTWFFKVGKPAEDEHTNHPNRLQMHDADSFDRLVGQYSESNVQRLDVRPLPMPLPMQTILEALPGLEPGEVLYIQHKRVPIHLLEALEDQPYRVHIHEVDEGDVRMLVRRE